MGTYISEFIASSQTRFDNGLMNKAEFLKVCDSIRTQITPELLLFLSPDESSSAKRTAAISNLSRSLWNLGHRAMILSRAMWRYNSLDPALSTTRSS